MTNPPSRKTTQSAHVKTALRLPPELHLELQSAADLNDRSLNAEILSRLRKSPLEDVKRQNEEIKAMIRQLIDRT